MRAASGANRDSVRVGVGEAPENGRGFHVGQTPRSEYPVDELRSWWTERARWLATVSPQPTPIPVGDMSLSDREPPRAFKVTAASYPSTTRDSSPGPCWMTVSPSN